MALDHAKEKDFSEWYSDVVIKSGMADYASVQGCIVYREISYGVWEKIQQAFDGMIKSTGHSNVYFPMFIPKSLLEREAEHFAGFTPEVAWVTKGGNTDLAEPLAIRPTSETIMYESYAKWLHSWRDLPFLFNQWCSVVRWETKATKPFLRGREFLWQEGHTVHETKEDADKEVMMILDFYRMIYEDYLAIPVLMGRKSDGEKFAGALYTTTLEAMMPDGKALQACTSHNLGQNFAKAFGLQFKDRNEKLAYAWQCSWGLSTRALGAMVMVHSDDNGLVLPPKVAPLQCVIVPIPGNDSIAQARVMDEVAKVKKSLVLAGITVKVDDREDKQPGWKYNEWELKGVPIRIEIGPKDVDKGAAMLVRRDNREKKSVPLAQVVQSVRDMMDAMQAAMFTKAKSFLESKIFEASDYAEFKSKLEKSKGFIKVSWCDEKECEDAVNKETTATVRIIPFTENKPTNPVCFHCGKPAKTIAYFAKSY